MADVDLFFAGQSRVFTIEDRAGPSHAPVYQTRARALAPSWAGGDVTPIRGPVADAYDQYEIIAEQVGNEGLPEWGLEFQKTRAVSAMLMLFRKKCPLDIQIHAGSCENPADFNAGWDLARVFEGARISNLSEGDWGAFDGEQSVPVLETVNLSGRDMYDLKQVLATEIAGTEIVQEVIAVAICDSRQCGVCGTASDGCQKVFWLTMSAGGSPGLTAELIFSSNGGATLGQTNVSTLAANEDPTDMACVGANLVVVSDESNSLHYAATADVLAGTATWAEVTTGFVALKLPNRIFSLGSTFTWIVADGGYIYFTADITAGVTPQTSGTVTAQNLNDIHGISLTHLVAVGESNAVLITRDGGATWLSVTGPEVGAVLNTVWMHSKTTWLVGTAGGKLWYTENSGGTWTQKRFTGDGGGQVRKIYFSTPSVGWMAHDTAAIVGRLLRTIDGGFSWALVPQDRSVSFPTNDRINDLVGCGANPNLLYGGGLGGNAVDGFAFKAA